MPRCVGWTLALFATASCGGKGVTEPATLSGTYPLVTIDAAPLPVWERTTPSGDELYTIGGELRVLTRGRMAVVRVTQWRSPVHGPRPPQPDTVIVTYQYDGARLLLSYPITVLGGPYTDTGTVDDEAITMQTRFFLVSQMRSYRYDVR
jgi:hypothetical protein